jgi:hypothetical protein
MYCHTYNFIVEVEYTVKKLFIPPMSATLASTVIHDGICLPLHQIYILHGWAGVAVPFHFLTRLPQLAASEGRCARFACIIETLTIEN